jgi:hypothetical protein
MNLRASYCLLSFVLLSTFNAFAAEPNLTFYVPFDGSLNAKIAGGDAQGKYGIKDAAPQFADGISGQGLLTGASNQDVSFKSPGNISADQWTITFWMKGLPGAQWNGGKYLQGFWELAGEQGEIMWFYRYTSGSTPWLFSRPKKGQGKTRWLMAPAAPEEKWHFWAVTWHKDSGAYLYLDGQLVGQSLCNPPDPVKTITIGQPANPSEQNKIIDEFKIYDAAMGPGTVARHYWQEGNFALHPQLTVAPAQHQIIIDGKIDAAEWQNAAGFAEMLGQESWSLESPRTWGKIAYDDKNVYIALHSDNPSEVKNDPDNAALHGFVKKDAVQHDGGVDDDDHFLIQLMPDATNEKLYVISTNGINTVYDAAGKNDASWESRARVKSVVDSDGWSLEAAIPLRSLGIDQIKDETSWKVNFGRVWRLLRQRTDLWAAGERVEGEPLSAQSELGDITFSAQPDATVDLQQFNMEADGHINAVLHLSDPAVTAHEVNVTLSRGNKILQEQKVLLQPQMQQTITLAALPQNADGALANIDVKSGTKVLFHQAAPLILERAGQLTMWNYPSTQQVRVGWVIQSASSPDALSLDAQLKDANGKVAQQVALKHLPALTGSTLVDVKTLPTGNYTVEVQIKDGENVIQQQALSYDKKPLPEWLGNTLGISNTPPPPWTDVKVARDKDTVSIWGRTYDYAGHLLPEQIINQGKPMLAAPMQLVMKTTDDSQSSNSATATSRWTKTTATRVESLRSQTLSAVNVQADSYVEFDGMTWMDLTVAPQSAKVLLNGLTLEIPLKSEWAKLIKPYDDYRLQHTGALAAGGWKGDASSMPWIGNGDGGFQFFQETTASWIGSKSIEITPDGKGAMVLRIHLIDAPATLNKPLHFAFGWMASPVKPAPKDHRDWRLLKMGGVGGMLVHDSKESGPVAFYAQKAAKRNNNLTFYFPWWTDWWRVPDDYKANSGQSGLVPIPADPPNDQMNAVRKYFGLTFYGAPYGRLTEMGTDNPWFEQFGDEWVPGTTKFTPDQTQDPALRIAKVSQAARSLRDFYAWGYDRLLNKGNVHALYFDVSRPSPDTNIYHGAGTPMPDGSIEPIRNILGTRKMFQRIYTLMKAKYPDGKIFYHMSGEIMLPVDSFSDALIDGENYTGLLDRKDNRGYEKVLSVDQFRAEYSAQNNFGPASVFLPEFDRSKAIMPGEWKDLGYQHADYLLGLIFLHNSNIWWTYMPYDHLAQVYNDMDSTGWNSDWKFIPYWNQKYFSLPQGVYISLYQSPDSRKVLLVMMNTSGKDQEMNLPLTFGKSTFTSAKTVYPQQAPHIQDGKFNVEISNNNFAAFLLQK